MNNVNYSIEEIKAWRKLQYEQGKPSSLRSFYIAHGSCPDCRGRGGWVRFMGETDRVDGFTECHFCKGTGNVFLAEGEKTLALVAVLDKQMPTFGGAMQLAKVQS
jgi:excinuclease UvrABC ATPase subunit